jgi:hypothetical protein
MRNQRIPRTGMEFRALRLTLGITERELVAEGHAAITFSDLHRLEHSMEPLAPDVAELWYALLQAVSRRRLFAAQAYTYAAGVAAGDAGVASGGEPICGCRPMASPPSARRFVADRPTSGQGPKSSRRRAAKPISILV